MLNIQCLECKYNIVLSTETQPFKCDYLNINTINSDLKLSWSSRLLNVLKQINTEYILFFLEDFFLMEPINCENFKRAFDLMESDINICAVQFPSVECDYKFAMENSESCYKKVSLFEPYRAKVMATMWRTKDFINLIFDNENPWICEKETSIRSIAYGEKIYRQDYTCSYPTFYYCINPKLGYGITQGKWLINNKVLFEKNGISNVQYSNLGILEKPKTYKELEQDTDNAHCKYMERIRNEKNLREILHVYKRSIIKKLKGDYILKLIKYKIFYMFKLQKVNK